MNAHAHADYCREKILNQAASSCCGILLCDLWFYSFFDSPCCAVVVKCSHEKSGVSLFSWFWIVDVVFQAGVQRHRASSAKRNIFYELVVADFDVTKRRCIFYGTIVSHVLFEQRFERA